MTGPSNSAPDMIDTDSLLKQLRRKEGTWVDWGKACQVLQKSGFSPQKIFEETGFESIQQNQIVVAAQVYQSLLTVGTTEKVRSHFEQRGSDSLYELRILTQADRARTAEFIVEHGLDSDQVKDIVKPIKEYSYRQTRPTGFNDSIGDAVAFNYWQLARQQSDLQSRSRLIAQGLRFAQSPDARQNIEKLLTDFAVVTTKPAPRFPLYRLETDTDLPCLLPVAGDWPLATSQFKAVPTAEPEEPFGIVNISAPGAWVSIPGWHVILAAEDAVALVAQFNALPGAPIDAPDKAVLVVIDRAQTQWDDGSYFVYDHEGQLDLQWFESEPTQPLLGRVLVIVRPKRILDESYTQELWQIDE